MQTVKILIRHTALALVDVLGVFTSKIGSVRRKLEGQTYPDFPIKSCTPISNSCDVNKVFRIWAFDLTAYSRKSSVRNGSYLDIPFSRIINQ